MEGKRWGLPLQATHVLSPQAGPGVAPLPAVGSIVSSRLYLTQEAARRVAPAAGRTWRPGKVSVGRDRG
jgi:hypothetical protein